MLIGSNIVFFKFKFIMKWSEVVFVCDNVWLKCDGYDWDVYNLNCGCGS